ncbi:unnamed protein product [Caenorhabditis auriculariae]|uniref:Large ribosomal subunit protein uL24m n=1 Tax=Caenorhabditis auriculariae TaxID=2777116 RepID=A0A8S1H3G6_9PELO|nr:unnamed protein product [Caenorhabditis auriculariae]
MFTSRVLRFPRKPFSELDYARHMPKEYVERMKRTVPRKVFDERFGAPAITSWTLHPEDYVPTHKRPWEDRKLQESLERADKYRSAIFDALKNKRLPDIEWTFFPGDLVQVMVGKDKGRQGTILSVSRDTNEVLVDGLHTILGEDMENSERYGVDKTFRWQEQPLSVDKKHVMLVDPNDEEPCEAKWQLNGKGDEYIRVSLKSGYEIPVPTQAYVTYDYVQPENYIEVEGKGHASGFGLAKNLHADFIFFRRRNKGKVRNC